MIEDNFLDIGAGSEKQFPPQEDTQPIPVAKVVKPVVEEYITVVYIGDSAEGVLVEDRATREKRIAPFEEKISRTYPTKIRKSLFINWSLK